MPALGALGLAGSAIFALPAAAAPVTGADPAAVEEPPVAASQIGPPLVIVGIGGLHWTDVDAGMPTLWRMIADGSVASISVRTASSRSCPLDAWLTLSAGRRTPVAPIGEPVEEDDSDLVPAECTPIPVIEDVGSQVGSPVPIDVPNWAVLAAAPTEQGGGSPGTLGDRIAAAGTCATAVGPGAALALADSTGHVPRYLASTSELDAEVLAACPVTVIDAGEPTSEPALRQLALRQLDEVLRQLEETVPDGGRIVVAGVHHTPNDELGLQVAVEWHNGPGPVGWLSSGSTRRPGIVTLADLTATALTTVGAEVDDLDGSPLIVDSDRRMSTQRTVENRRYLTEMTTTVSHLLPVFLVVLAIGSLAAFGAVLASRRTRARQQRALTRTATAVLLVAACAPTGAYLAALSRWWGSGAPTVMASLWTVVATTAVALLAWVVSRRLRPGPWRLGGAAAGATWLVLTVDGLTGTLLQQGSILGVIPTLGARYYGFGNLTFAVYVAAALVLAGALATAALDRGRRRAAVAWVLAVGLVTVVIDGWPAFGADLGGVLATVPAFAMLLIAVTGATLNRRRVLLTGLATLAAVSIAAVVDWLLPGTGSHLGRFVQRIIDGEALPVIAGKAAAAWATVANPLGAVAVALCLAACLAVVGPRRWRPAAVDRAYRRWPLLRPVVRSVVVVAFLGTVLNDSGIAVGVTVLAVAGGLIAVSWSDARVAALRVEPGPDAPLRRMPAVIVATGGGLLGVLLLGGFVAPGPTVVAGDVTSSAGTPVVQTGEHFVVIGTSGVRWQDVSRSVTPNLWRALRDGAAAGGVAPGVTDMNRDCPAAGWLALSAGRAPVTGVLANETWLCAPWSVNPLAADAPPGGVVVAGWDQIEGLQAASEFNPRLGALGDGLAAAGACATAVGPGAALALANGSGEVGRYRELGAALDDAEGTFACAVTIVDAGAAPRLPDPPPGSLQTRDAALSAIDVTVGRVLRAAPDGAKVLIVDVGDPSTGRPWLGIGMVDAGDESEFRFLSASSTRWEGVVRLLDVPTTVLAAVGAQNPPELTGSPVTTAGPRPSDVSETVDQLGALTVRDHTVRGVAGSITTVPMLVALALLGVIALLGRGSTRGPLGPRGRRAVDSALLVIASMPAGLFLMTTWSWEVGSPVVGMWGSLVASTLIVAGLAALVPWRPAWAAPAVLSALTAGLLTLDAVLGTPLHRGSPLGPAPTLGGRYYGFGNPTYSLYVVAMVFTAAALATLLVRRGHRRLAVVAASFLGLVTLVVDLWPTLGADLGGGLVLVPACAVVVLAVAGVRVNWRRLALIGVAGLVVVAGIGIVDWLRPAAERSHLGRFVQAVIDQTAWETVTRKAGYAAVTITSGPTAWLTLAVVVAAALLLWRGSRVRAVWFTRVEEQWPLVRPTLFALLVAAVGGAIVNDYGVRIATMMLFSAVPLVAMLAVRSLPGGPGENGLTDAGRPAHVVPRMSTTLRGASDGSERSRP